MKSIIYRLLSGEEYRSERRVQLGVLFVNFIFQRVFRINHEIKWPVHYTSKVTGDIIIGKDVWISFAVSGNCYIQGINGIEIGDGTIFAPGVKIISANHNLYGPGWVKESSIKIGKDCWIGANAVILPGVKLGNRCVVGAGSVVTRSFEDDSIICGVPAKLLRKR